MGIERNIGYRRERTVYIVVERHRVVEEGKWERRLLLRQQRSAMRLEEFPKSDVRDLDRHAAEYPIQHNEFWTSRLFVKFERRTASGTLEVEIISRVRAYHLDFINVSPS